jgi:O-antigen/teichoic acid export membrane protein
MKTLLFRWLNTNGVMLRNASSLVSSQLVTSALGFVFWWLAARQFTTDSVGISSAAISAMALLGSAAVLGLGTLLLGEIPRQPEKAPALVTTALIVSSVVGLLLGFVAAIVAPLVSGELGPLSAGAGSALLFALGVSLTSMTLVVDQALIGMLRGDLQLWRNSVFAVVKLVVLAVLGLIAADIFGLTIYFTWVIGIVISMAFLGFFALRHGRTRLLRPDWTLVHKLGKAALGHHALNLSLQMPGFVLPVLVTVLLSASTNAYFYIAWMISTFVFFVPAALTTVLYAVSSADPRSLASKMRQTMGLSMLAGLAAIVAVFLAGGLVLELFGTGYAEQADWTLRILTLAIVPLTVRSHFVAIYRVRGQVTRASVFTLAGGTLELALAAVGAIMGGLVGLAVGWLVAQCIEAALMSPIVFRTMTDERRTATHEGTKDEGRTTRDGVKRIA